MADGKDNVEMFGVPVSSVTFDEVCARAAQRITSREPGFIVTPNVNHVCLAQRLPEFRAAYHEAFLSLADGVPLLWAARLFGLPPLSKMSGSDMVPMLSRFAAEHGYSVFFLGGTPGTGERTAEILKRENPTLRVAGLHCPPYGFEDDSVEAESILNDLRKAQPDICFVALGSPKQELWMSQNYRESGVPLCIGVGASFDFISGRIRRAPAWLQHSGFEWLWRLAMEPRRLWRRYLGEGFIFARLLFQEYFARRRRAAGSLS